MYGCIGKQITIIMDDKIIHLFILNECTHHCKMCCNKQYSIDDIPVVTVEELKKAETVLLTGGEPFLLDGVCNLAERIKQQYNNVRMIYVYTCGDSLLDYLKRGNKLHHIDGVNISPKNKYDAECVNEMFSAEIYRRQIVSL